MVILIMCLFPAALSAQGPPLASPRAAQIKSHLTAILAGPEYQQDGPKNSFLVTIGKWIAERVAHFFRWLNRLFPQTGPRGTDHWMGWVILGLLLLGIAYLIAYAIRGMAGRMRPRPVKKSERGLPLVELVEEKEIARTEPDAWLDVARHHAATGDLRRAYRCAFIAVLVRLDRIGAIRFDPARTNGEYLRSLSRRPDLFTLMKPLAYAFDARWYGTLPVTQTDYERCLAVYGQIVPESHAF
ncbi:MAG TPA: DUF4129 domain-containing protein [Chthonomonadales bacterium]|nr:DUF4129 domain-containing protein [Chthonomonadales bacterium]